MITVLTCDRCSAEGRGRVEGVERVAFSFDGHHYVLDLCAPHAGEFQEVIRSMISWAAERDEPPMTGRRQADKARVRAIRSWAKATGFTFSDRGRIPREVLDAYDEAQAS